MRHGFAVLVVLATGMSMADETSKWMVVTNPIPSVVTNAHGPENFEALLAPQSAIAFDSIHPSSVIEATKLKDQLVFGEVLVKMVRPSETMPGLYELVAHPTSHSGVDVVLLPCDESRALSLRVGRMFSIAGNVVKVNATAVARVSGDKTANNAPSIGLVLETGWSSGK